MYQTFNLPKNLEFTNTKFLDTIGYAWFSFDTNWFTEYFKMSNYLIFYLSGKKEKIQKNIEELFEKRGIKKGTYKSYEILMQISWKEKSYILDVCDNEGKLIFRRDDENTTDQSISNMRLSER